MHILFGLYTLFGEKTTAFISVWKTLRLTPCIVKHNNNLCYFIIYYHKVLVLNHRY